MSFGKVKHLPMLQDSLQMDLRHLSEYIEETEKAQESSAVNFANDINERAKDIPEEQQNDWHDWYTDDYWKLSTVFPGLMRSSMFVISYSLLEHRLLEICRILQKQQKHKITLKDLKDEGIRSGQTFLKGVVGVEFPDGKKEWSDITNYNRLRNAIIHADGILQTEAVEKMKPFLAATKTITVDDHGRIHLERGFCAEVLGTVHGFFSALFDELKKSETTWV